MNREQELFNLSIKLENIAALTRAVLTILENTSGDPNSLAQRDACSLTFLLQSQITEADKLLMEIIKSYGKGQQAVKVDITTSVVVATTEQLDDNTRRTAV